jgi:hypothetical protein
MCIFVIFPILNKQGDVSEVNTEVVTYIRFRYRFPFTIVLNVDTTPFKPSKRVYGCGINMADGICPESVITSKCL